MPNGGIEGGLEMSVLINEGSYWWGNYNEALTTIYNYSTRVYSRASDTRSHNSY